jgi:hypothetical protein
VEFDRSVVSGDLTFERCEALRSIVYWYGPRGDGTVLMPLPPGFGRVDGFSRRLGLSC